MSAKRGHKLNSQRKQKRREKRKLRAKEEEEAEATGKKSRMIHTDNSMNEPGWSSVIRGFSLYQFPIS
jgi:hypothetical protein